MCQTENETRAAHRGLLIQDVVDEDKRSNLTDKDAQYALDSQSVATQGDNRVEMVH
jgi:hypothetical protein